MVTIPRIIKEHTSEALNYSTLEDYTRRQWRSLRLRIYNAGNVNSIQVLRRKLKPFLSLYKKPLNGNFSDEQFETAIGSLVHKGFGNNNREKLNDSHRAVIFQRYADGDAKPNIEQVYAELSGNSRVRN